MTNESSRFCQTPFVLRLTLYRLYSSLLMEAASSMRQDLYAKYHLPRPSVRSASPLSACARRLSRHEPMSSSEELKNAEHVWVWVICATIRICADQA